VKNIFLPFKQICISLKTFSIWSNFKIKLYCLQNSMSWKKLHGKSRKQ